MPEYKLTYFNALGRGELIRWCFAYGGIQYEDERLDYGQWAQRKKEMPGGQIPVLFVDGKPLPESLAISRYVAKQAGLVPKDDLQAAYCDAAVDTLNSSLVDVWTNTLYSKESAAEKTRVINEVLIPKVTPLLKRLNERLSTRNWFISDKVTWADLMLCYAFTGMESQIPGLLKNYPHVTKVVNNVQNLPTIKKWIKERPSS